MCWSRVVYMWSNIGNITKLLRPKMLETAGFRVPGKTDSTALICPSWKSLMNSVGCQSVFHAAICRKPATIDSCRSSDNMKLATFTYPTFVKTQRAKRGKSYTVVRYVASIRHISDPYSWSIFFCQLVWLAKTTGDAPSPPRSLHRNTSLMLLIRTC